MPSCRHRYHNWKDTAKPGETREHWEMRMNRNARKARRRRG